MNKVLPSVLSASALALAVAAYFLQSSPRRTPSPGPAAGDAAVHADAPGRPSHTGRTGGAAPDAAGEPAAWTWSSMESEDYRKYIANLRSIECPEPTIRDIILADINKLYAPREAQFKDPTNTPANPWETSVATARTDAATTRKAAQQRRKQLREVEKEKAAVIKELLGITLPLSPLRTATSRNYERFEAALNALPPDKREPVRELQESYWETDDQLAETFKNKRTKEFAGQYRQANEARRAAMGAILGPELLEEYEMRVSTTATRLNTELAPFNLTEDQFKAIYRAKAEIEEPFGGSIPLAQFENPDKEEIAMKSAELNQLLTQSLGTEGYSRYVRSQDSNWQALDKLKTRFELADGVIEKAYEMQTQMQTMSVNSDPDQTKEFLDVQRQLQAARRSPAGRDPAEIERLQKQMQALAELQNHAQQEAQKKRQQLLNEISTLLGDKAGKVFAARNAGMVAQNNVVIRDESIDTYGVQRLIPPAEGSGKPFQIINP